MNLEKSSLPAADLKTGNGTVGETPQLVTEVGFVGLCRGVTVASHPDNEGVLYVGAFALKPGMSQLFEVDDSSALMIVASQASQEYSWLAK